MTEVTKMLTKTNINKQNNEHQTQNTMQKAQKPW